MCVSRSSSAAALPNATHLSAIQDQVLAGRELALVTRQIQCQVCDIDWLCQSRQGHLRDKLLQVLLVVRHACKVLEQSRVRQQRANGVDADLLRAELGSQGFGSLASASVTSIAISPFRWPTHIADSCLGGVVPHQAWSGSLTADAADVDQAAAACLSECR